MRGYDTTRQQRFSGAINNNGRTFSSSSAAGQLSSPRSSSSASASFTASAGSPTALNLGRLNLVVLLLPIFSTYLFPTQTSRPRRNTHTRALKLEAGWSPCGSVACRKGLVGNGKKRRCRKTTGTQQHERKATIRYCSFKGISR